MDLHDNMMLRRKVTARALTEAGYPVAASTLATMASRGGGPPYRLWGRVPMYCWGDALRWARSRTSSPRCSTCEERT